jgi:hypothetical protein
VNLEPRRGAAKHEAHRRPPSGTSGRTRPARPRLRRDGHAWCTARPSSTLTWTKGARSTTIRCFVGHAVRRRRSPTVRTVDGSCTPEVSVTGTLSSMPPSNKRTSPMFFGLKYFMAVFAPGLALAPRGSAAVDGGTGGSLVFNGWREDGNRAAPVGNPMPLARNGTGRVIVGIVDAGRFGPNSRRRPRCSTCPRRRLTGR